MLIPVHIVLYNRKDDLIYTKTAFELIDLLCLKRKVFTFKVGQINAHKCIRIHYKVHSSG